MAQVTINLSASTWIQQGDSSNHSTDTLLNTSRIYNNTNNYFAVLQFTIPSTYRYKRITKATLNFYTRKSGGFTQSGASIAPYNVNAVLNTLTGTNYNTLGSLGEWVTVEPYSSYGASYPKWRSADVTSLYSSNLYNNTYFTVFISAWPGYPTSPATIDGLGAANPAQLILDYEDVTQLPPTPSYPAGVYVNENTDILFAWAWNSSTSATQASVRLSYKKEGTAPYTHIDLTQTAHTYLMSGGLEQGTYIWKIKGTNDAGEESSYSQGVRFYVVGKPAAPIINAVPNRTLTEITWNASDQNAFDITITDSDGKILINDSVASSESSYKPNIFLKGTYTVAIRTRNSTGLVSDWSYKAFSITASGPAKPSIRLLQNDAQVFITVTVVSGIKYAIIRKEDREGADEQILGIVEGDTFMDATFGFGIPYRYVVRAWSTGGYTDSDPERICYPKTAIVLETKDKELIIDKSEDTFLPFSEDVNGDMAVFNCTGRDLPIVEHSEFESRVFRSRLYIHDYQKEKLVAMAKENRIYYRDYSGRAFPVAIQPPINFERWMGNGYMADMQFVMISETEVVVNV